MIKATGYAASHSFSRLKPLAFERREAGPGEVQIDVLYCGVCHSDIHQVENDWGNTVCPCMPATRSSAASRRLEPALRATRLAISSASVA